MNSRYVLRVVGKVLIPFIALFAFYTQFHGDYGPGGGFQAGVILASAFVLYGMIYDVADLDAAYPPRWFEVGAALGVLLYAGVGIVTMLLGGNFLEYGPLGGHDHGDGHAAVHGQHYGILLVELGVGLTVTCVFVTIFTTFRRRGGEG